MAGCNSSTNMQLFQEMKYKFPDIPEEVIQNCIFKHSGNREACIQLLSKENLNYIYPSTETNFPTSHYYSMNVHSKLPIAKNGSNLYLRNSLLPTPPSHVYPNSKPKIGRCSFSYFSPVSPVPCNDNSSNRPREIQSAPTMQSEQNPFLSAYNNEWYFNINSVHNPVVFNTSSCKNTSDQKTTQNIQSRLTVSTPSRITSNIMDNQMSNPNVTQARHVTTLKINPQPVYLIEKYGYNPSSSVYTNIMPSGRHMTSVNLQLRPPSSEAQPPIEITTTPLNCVMSKNNDKDFNSQVRISINSTGATLTAMRTQKKPPITSPTAHHSVSMQRNVTHVSTVPTFPSNANVFKNTEAGECYTTENYTVTSQNCSQFQPLNTENLINMPESWNAANQPVLPYQNTSSHNQRRRNAYNELAYTQALLLHQKARLEVLQKVLDDEKKILSRMKMEVNNMEEHLLQRRLNLTAISNMTDVQNLREENRRLRVECHCLSMEVDFCLKGQAPLGETDEDFYKNIFTGPLGPIPPVPNTEGLSSQAISASAFQSNKENKRESQNVEEKDMWKCSKCTFANHPALNKCEMCEMTRTTDSDGREMGPTYCSRYRGMMGAPQVDRRMVSDLTTEPRPRQGIGQVQICVRRNRITTPSEGLELHLTHRYPRR
ncbi:TGF-beta-activated kinase 1 and MAP3K7-binding protein 2-like isoform X1 [Centruroides vittatus]|uniref:TGF-beta-activated kinase 1 and MAP3K7-binding protein 2-like isoform X1 n=1 Tax=Centruroides vittatus TaxID=120091 RepID=UPI00350F5308